MVREIAGRKEIVKSNSVHRVNKNPCFYLHSDFRGHLGMGYFLMFSHINALALLKWFFFSCLSRARYTLYLGLHVLICPLL